MVVGWSRGDDTQPEMTCVVVVRAPSLHNSGSRHRPQHTTKNHGMARPSRRWIDRCHTVVIRSSYGRRNRVERRRATREEDGVPSYGSSSIESLLATNELDVTTPPTWARTDRPTTARDGARAQANRLDAALADLLDLRGDHRGAGRGAVARVVAERHDPPPHVPRRLDGLWRSRCTSHDSSQSVALTLH